MDKINKYGWVAIELSPVGEKSDNLPRLKQEITKFLGEKTESFFPFFFWYDHGQCHKVSFMDGYIFVKILSSQRMFSPQAARILKYLLKNPGHHGKMHILTNCMIEDKLWNTVLGELLSNKIIEKSGEKRGTKYKRSKPYPDIKDIFELEKSPFFLKVLTYRSENKRLPQIIPDEEIQRLKDVGEKYLDQRIGEGDIVEIKNGIYKNMTGKVISRNNIYAMIQIKLRSVEIITKVPFFITEIVETRASIP